MSTRVEENERVRVVYEDTGPKHDENGVHVTDDLRVLACGGDACVVLGGRALIVPRVETRLPPPDHIMDREDAHTVVVWDGEAGGCACSCGWAVGCARETVA